MSYMRDPVLAKDWPTWRFGRARQIYRGPRPDLDQPYVAAIGGSETFGKFVRCPWPQFLEARLDFPVANFGTPGGGPSFFLKDPALLEALSKARACIVQVMPAWATSNRLFTVRKRRNERLNTVSDMLKALYAEIDVAAFRYTHNLLHRLYMADPQKFRVVDLELRAAWTARMRDLAEQIETRKVLFWFSERRPEDDGGPNASPEKLVSPAFVNRAMIEAIRPHFDAVVEYVAPPGLARGPGDGIEEGPAGAQRGARSAASQAMHEEGAASLEATVRALARIGED